jgi:phospholipid transport system substrate-binding protein
VSALATLVLALALGAHPALAENGENSARPLSTAGSRQPLDLVSGSVARVTAIVESGPAGAAEMGQRQAALRQMAEELFDFDEMARLVLGQHWKDRSPKERAEFVRLFIDVLERAYLMNIGSYRLATITFQGEVIKGSSAQVRSRIVTDKGSVIPVEYRLAHTGVRWAVYDVEADGISLISNYRSQLNSILRTSTFAELLERLRGRQASAAPRQGP